MIGLDAFTIKNKTATINEFANDKSCGAMHDDGVVEFKMICLYQFAWNGISFCKSASVPQQLILFN